MTQTAGDSQQNVRVVVRIRPRDTAEMSFEEGQAPCIYEDPRNSTIVLPTVNKSYKFDGVFGPSSSQEQTYGCVKPLIDGFMQGYNATVLAYGQTGSGKTYTMACGEASHFDGTDPQMGIMPRVIDRLFREMQNKPDVDCELHASYLEIYNDDMFDLLSPDVDANRVTGGVAEERVYSVHDCLNILGRGAMYRKTASTVMNAHSSRSHAIFTLTLVQNHKVEVTAEEMTDDEPRPSSYVDAKMSKFHFVDLAGSERAKRTQAAGTRLKEGCHINSGLLALGNVICALTAETSTGTDERSRHVPYRDSKLTRLLQDSLGGNARTVMIACVSGAVSDFAETHNAIGYASRARNIKNRAVVNRDPQNARITALQLHIAMLTRENAELKQRNAHGVNAESLRRPPSEGIRGVGDSMALENWKKRVTELETTLTAFRQRESDLVKAYDALKAHCEANSLSIEHMPPLPDAVNIDMNTGIVLTPDSTQAELGRKTTELAELELRFRLLEANQVTLQDALTQKIHLNEALEKNLAEIKNRMAAWTSETNLDADELMETLDSVEGGSLPTSLGNTAQGEPAITTITLDSLTQNAEKAIEIDHIEYQRAQNEQDRALEEKRYAELSLNNVEGLIQDVESKMKNENMQGETQKQILQKLVLDLQDKERQLYNSNTEKESLEKRLNDLQKQHGKGGSSSHQVHTKARDHVKQQLDSAQRKNSHLQDQVKKLKEQQAVATKKEKNIQAMTTKYQADLKKYQCDKGRLQKELNEKEKHHREVSKRKEILFEQTKRRMLTENRNMSKMADQERQRRLLLEKKIQTLKGQNEMLKNSQKRRVDGRLSKQRGRMPNRGGQPMNQNARSASCVITGVGIGSSTGNLNSTFGSVPGNAFNTTSSSFGGEAPKHFRLPNNPNDKEDVLNFVRSTLKREMKRSDDAEKVKILQAKCAELKDVVMDQRKQVNIFEQNELYATIPEDKDNYRIQKEQANMHLSNLNDQLEHNRALLRKAADDHATKEKTRREQVCQTGFGQLQDYCEANMDLMAPMLLDEMLNYKKHERKLESEIQKYQETGAVTNESTATSEIVIEKDKQIAELRQRVTEMQAKLSVENSVVHEASGTNQKFYTPNASPPNVASNPDLVQENVAQHQEALRHQQAIQQDIDMSMDIDMPPQQPPKTPALDLSSLSSDIQGGASASNNPETTRTVPALSYRDARDKMKKQKAINKEESDGAMAAATAFFNQASHAQLPPATSSRGGGSPVGTEATFDLSASSSNSARGRDFLNRMTDDMTARRERQHEPQQQTYHEQQAEFHNGLRGGPAPSHVKEGIERDESLSSLGGFYQRDQSAPWKMSCVYRQEIPESDKAVFCSFKDNQGPFSDHLFTGSAGVMRQWSMAEGGMRYFREHVNSLEGTTVRIISAQESQPILAVGTDRSCLVYDGRTDDDFPIELRDPDGPRRVTAACWTSEFHLAVASPRPNDTNTKANVRVWDIRNPSTAVRSEPCVSEQTCLTKWPGADHPYYGCFVGGARDNYLRIFDPRLTQNSDASTREVRWNFQCIRPQSYEPVCSALFSSVGNDPNALHLVSASSDKNLRVYQLPKSPAEAIQYGSQDQYSALFQTRQVEAHAKAISSLCALPGNHESQAVVSAAKDGSIRMWRLQMGSASSSPETNSHLPSRLSSNGRAYIEPLDGAMCRHGKDKTVNTIAALSDTNEEKMMIMTGANERFIKIWEARHE